jgi:formamidopyrimidine-DNA glycosylase
LAYLPELPDILLYVHALEPRIVHQPLTRIRLASPFLLRSVEPPLESFVDRNVTRVGRLGKRIVWSFDEHDFLVFHLMIAGRFRWYPPGARIPAKIGLAAFDFPTGTLVLTEAGTKRRASLEAVRGDEALAALDPGGLDVFSASDAEFRDALVRENHTLKRALTDPRLFDGIGNAYSDEILHAARLSPFKQTQQLDADDVNGCSRPAVRSWGPGARASKRKPARRFPSVSRHSGRPWPCTAGSASRVRGAARPFSGSCTRKTKPTTVQGVRRPASSSPTGRCRG